MIVQSFVKWGGVIFKSPDSVLTIGISGTTSVPTQLLLEGHLIVNGHVDLYKGTKVVIRQEALLSIGSGTYINEYSRIFCAKQIVIGSSCAIAWNVNIMDTDMHEISAEGFVINSDAEVFIGNNVWICANSFVSKGTNIPDNVIIGANTITSKSLQAKSIYIGNSSKPIKRFDNWR